MFTLAQLGCFVAVAEELHFGRAAARLHMTQPPLSRQIRLLEQAVGVTLLDRDSRTVRVTPAGRVFLAEARRILRLAEESSLAVRRIPTGDGGTLTVGFTAASVHGYVQAFLRRVSFELPHVDLVLREMVTADQVEAIASGDVDLGFVRPPVTRAGLASRVVHRERLLLAAPVTDKLVSPGGSGSLGAADGSDGSDGSDGGVGVGVGRVGVAELDGRPLIMYSPVESRYFYELLLGMTVRAGVRPRHVQYVSQVHTMLALVQAGIGLAVVPESAAALHPDGVAFRDLELDSAPDAVGAQAPLVELAATWHESADNPALTRALALLSPS